MVEYDHKVSDARIKLLMFQCGFPNSTSLYQAFKQFEMEVRMECSSGQQVVIPASLETPTRI